MQDKTPEVSCLDTDLSPSNFLEILLSISFLQGLIQFRISPHRLSRGLCRKNDGLATPPPNNPSKLARYYLKERPG